MNERFSVVFFLNQISLKKLFFFQMYFLFVYMYVSLGVYVPEESAGSLRMGCLGCCELPDGSTGNRSWGSPRAAGAFNC